MLMAQDWSCLRVFEGHTHYVMSLAFNPKNTNLFASVSLDRALKLWDMNHPNPTFSFGVLSSYFPFHDCLLLAAAHEKGINTVSYYCGHDYAYLATGGDDKYE